MLTFAGTAYKGSREALLLVLLRLRVIGEPETGEQ